MKCLCRAEREQPPSKRQKREQALLELQQSRTEGRRLPKRKLIHLAKQVLLQQQCATQLQPGDIQEDDETEPPRQDNCLRPKVAHLRTKLMSWQCSAVNWMVEREGRLWHGFRGGLLCDDMGLGKTLSCLCMVELDWMFRGSQPPAQREEDVHVATTLVVLDASVIHIWRQQACQHFLRDTYREGQMPDLGREEGSLLELPACRLAFVTYSMLVAIYKREMKLLAEGRRRRPLKELRGSELLFRVIWRRVVADEGHCLCRASILMVNAFRSLRSSRRWVLTGTPIRNRVRDFPGVLHALSIHKQHHRQAEWRLLLSRSKADMDCRETLLQKCYLVEVPLPDFQSSQERELYDLVELDRAWLSPPSSHLEKLTLLRQLCVAPRLLPRNRSRRLLNSQFTPQFRQLLASYMQLEQPSSKMAEALRIVERALRVGGLHPEQVVLFFRESGAAALFEDWLRPLTRRYGCGSILLDGSCSQKERVRMLSRFDRGDVRVALLTIATGGQGISLVRANTVIMLEPHWSDSSEKQAWDRCYRLGQYKDVIVHRLYIKGTEEDRIREQVRIKSAQACQLMGRDLYRSGIHRLSYEEAQTMYEVPDELAISVQFSTHSE